MRLEYQWRGKVIVSEDPPEKIYSPRVKAGWILMTLTCYLHMPDSKSGDVAEILVDDGTQALEIRSRARDAGKQGMSALRPFYVGEYQRVIGHSPDSEIGHEICLTLIGEMMPLKRWRKGKV